LKDATLPTIKVHATAVFSILTSFIRRTDRNARVMGTLLGEVKEDGVVVTDCFAVPFTEKVEESYVAIDQKYHSSMYAFHRRNNKKEKVVGWYCSTTAQGQFVVDNSSLIRDFYSGECENPVHLVVDTTLLGDTVGIRGFMSNQLIVGEEILASAFKEVCVELALTEAECTCLHHMIQHQESAGAGAGKSKWDDSCVVSTIPSGPASVETSILQLQRVLASIQTYVDAVVDGRATPSREIGMALTETLNNFSAAYEGSISSMGSTTNSRGEGAGVFDARKAALQSKVQDLLMASYITTLTQTQTIIAEKLNRIL